MGLVRAHLRVHTVFVGHWMVTGIDRSVLPGFSDWCLGLVDWCVVYANWAVGTPLPYADAQKCTCQADRSSEHNTPTHAHISLHAGCRASACISSIQRSHFRLSTHVLKHQSAACRGWRTHRSHLYPPSVNAGSCVVASIRSRLTVIPTPPTGTAT